MFLGYCDKKFQSCFQNTVIVLICRSLELQFTAAAQQLVAKIKLVHVLKKIPHHERFVTFQHSETNTYIRLEMIKTNKYIRLLEMIIKR